ncbi:hypothetical protein [Mesorhizobium sp. IMUNJ 23232]|uniref:DUF7220 family protein n=1 Tax=Mesorhizobium sp. IMUNJ 23232 TaxID=3376064 RepID=UPI00379D554F
MTTLPPLHNGSQSRTGSFIEALANVIAGYIVAIIVQRLAYPQFGIETTLATDGLIAAIFTAASLARSYILRRLFKHLADIDGQHHFQGSERLRQRLVRRP